MDRSVPDDVLKAERAHLNLAQDCLTLMHAEAERIADYGVDQLASYALGKIRAERLQALEADPDAPPFFGRTDNEAAVTGGRGRVEALHIGRRHIRAPDGDPVVIDWRAPISRSFYRATPTDRMGVLLRRRFGFREGELTSYEDEHLDAGEASGLGSSLLREEIERPRSGPMRDIVATIQPDQDEFVRLDLDTSLCIQGAPGTGKTAVGLHRAAYLLYTYPERLRRSGVLVVGPNLAFLRYIAQVLPALGEGGIEQSTVEALLGHAPIRAVDDEATAVLKGDARMAVVVRRLLASHIRNPTNDVLVFVGDRRFRIPVERMRRYVDDTRRELSTTLRWNTARERLRQQIAQDVRRQREDRGGAPTDAETARLARSKPVRDAVDALWPALEPGALLVRLFTEPTLLARCAREILTDDEQALLHWATAPKSVRAAKFTAADLVLLDELQGWLETTASYVHIVVDEAQDLSAMQCRAVGRRCPLGSVTVLGDLAQATTPWAPGSWGATLEHLGHADAQVRPLTVGYRVPGEVLELANRLLPAIAAQVPAATSMRSGAGSLQFAPAAELATQVRRALGYAGSVAVIAADAAVADALRTAGLEFDLWSASGEGVAEASGEQPAVRVSVVAASAAKGLEFDSVLVLSPAQIVRAEGAREVGLRRLYVAITRAVSRLVIVGDEPLPDELS